MKIDLENVGHRLEELRLALDLPKGEFARSFGEDPSSYSKIIRGQKPLLADKAFAISETWGATMDYIYRGRLIGLPDELTQKLRKARTGQKQ